MDIELELEQIGSERPWVARITGLDQKFGFAREFISGIKDYSRANKPRTRGVYTSYTLDEGSFYEINSPHAWGKTHRYFARIENGKILKIDAAELRRSFKPEAGVHFTHDVMDGIKG